jgi:hypothetical protein
MEEDFTQFPLSCVMCIINQEIFCRVHALVLHGFLYMCVGWIDELLLAAAGHLVGQVIIALG